MTNLRIVLFNRLQAIQKLKSKRVFHLVTFISFAIGFFIFLNIGSHAGNYKLKEETDNSHCLLERANFTVKMNKTFLYLIQGPSCLPKHLKGERQIGCGSTCHCDVLMLGYKQKCTTPSLKHVEYIHKKGTTWSTGRNYLYEHAMNSTMKYLYYIFMDEDITLQPNSNSNDAIISYGLWRSFERFLLTYKPAIGTTSYCSSIGTRCKSRQVPVVYGIKGYLFDAAFNAIHHKALPDLLPYRLERENVSWWYSQWYFTLLAKHYFKGFVLVYTEVNAVNTRHSEYPTEHVSNKLSKILEEEVSYIVKQRKKISSGWKGAQVDINAKVFCKC